MQDKYPFLQEFRLFSYFLNKSNLAVVLSKYFVINENEKKFTKNKKETSKLRSLRNNCVSKTDVSDASGDPMYFALEPLEY